MSVSMLLLLPPQLKNCTTEISWKMMQQDPTRTFWTLTEQIQDYQDRIWTVWDLMNITVVDDIQGIRVGAGAWVLGFGRALGLSLIHI